MADKRPLDDSELDSLFGVAMTRATAPSDDLVARILADAEAQVSRVAEVPKVRPEGFLATILAGIGGWPAAAGLATATVAGLAIGLNAPDTLDTLSVGYFYATDSSYQLEDLLPSYGDLLGEG